MIGGHTYWCANVEITLKKEILRIKDRICFVINAFLKKNKK